MLFIYHLSATAAHLELFCSAQPDTSDSRISSPNWSQTSQPRKTEKECGNVRRRRPACPERDGWRHAVMRRDRGGHTPLPPKTGWSIAAPLRPRRCNRRARIRGTARNTCNLWNWRSCWPGKRKSLSMAHATSCEWAHVPTGNGGPFWERTCRKCCNGGLDPASATCISRSISARRWLFWKRRAAFVWIRPNQSEISVLMYSPITNGQIRCDIFQNTFLDLLVLGARQPFNLFSRYSKLENERKNRERLTLSYRVC